LFLRANINRLFSLKLRTLIFGHPLASKNAEEAKVGVGGGVPVYDLNLIVLKTLKYASALTPQVTAVHIASDPNRAAKLLKHWAEQHMEIPLEIVESPYRATVHDLLNYVDKVEKNGNFDTITIAIPEYVPEKLWQNILHNQTGQLMKLMLLFRKSILVTSVPYHSVPKEALLVDSKRNGTI